MLFRSAIDGVVDSPNGIEADRCRPVTRQTVDGKPAGGWIPEQRVSLETALRGYTSSAAYAEFEEHRKGMLKPGYLADVLVLDRDPFAIPKPQLHTLRVKLTVAAGKVVFER